MNDDAGFLSAIRATPNDTTTRLVYADWLEDRGDPRAELVRVEEEMRQLPVYSDRYWELKPRRNALLALAAADWLEVMGYGTDCPPVFRHGLPDGWRARWRLIREFTERWHRRALPDVGGRAEEVRRTEAALGRSLPPSLREWVAFAHDVRTSPHYHDVLRDVYQMCELTGQSSISLLLQCEGDYHWAVRHQDLALPDPPVHGFHWDYQNGDEDTFVPDRDNPVATTVTSFALCYTMGYAGGEGGAFGADVADSDELIRNLEATFPVRFRVDRMEVFETDNIHVRLHHWTSREYVVVEIFKPLPPEAIPTFLWDYIHHGGAFHGTSLPGSGSIE